ncbi:PREDICTED: SCY1-like protein 2 [Priapulus caudatus]|uniref:SCY1-like protein 2 n=1 Tax=Priapulus caudatus TaxID=37621 RepID=A0ABM1DPY8_PRICU|nr:PREDICTED: SCY1-like protein 2 [Priapulus caudatus]
MTSPKTISKPASRKSEVLSMIKQTLLPDDKNPIVQYFDISRQVASAGPELVWKIYDAHRKTDKQEASVFVFEKRIADKLHKPKRRETVTEVLRRGVRQLERMKHPKILQLIHGVEETNDTLAFATEPVLASLANLTGNHDKIPHPVASHIKDYEFLDMELKYGILQVTEALSYIHGTEQMIHGNVSPQSIIVNTKGTWKLAGMEFVQKLQEGMVICSLYNNGRSLIESNHSSIMYLKKLDELHASIPQIANRMPLGLQESVLKMLSTDVRYRPTSLLFSLLEDTLQEALGQIPAELQEPVQKMLQLEVRHRPTAQLFSLIKYFSDPVVAALQYIDVLEQKDLSQKQQFFSTLPHHLPSIPKKMLHQHVFPCIQSELREYDLTAHVLKSFIYLLEVAEDEEYQSKLLPTLYCVFVLPKSTQDAGLRNVQLMQHCLGDEVIKKKILPKAKIVFHKTSSIKIQMNCLECIDRLLDNLDKMTILDEVLPFLLDIQSHRGNPPEVIMPIVDIYRHMMCDKRFGMTHSLLASKVMPTLLPYTINPSLRVEEFSALIEVLKDMLDIIDRNQKNKLSIESLPVPGSDKPYIMRHRHSMTDAPSLEMLNCVAEGAGESLKYYSI